MSLHRAVRHIRYLLALLLSLLVPSAWAAPYTVALVPQFKARQLQAEWRPLLDRISAETGLEFKLRFYSSIPEFESGFLAGEPDFAFMNPYHAVMAHKKQGYIPLLSNAQPLTGILVVAANSAIHSVEDLNERRIAFPAPNAFGASLYMRALLIEKERLIIHPQYVSTHANVYRQVLLGDVAAGGGVNQTFADLPDSLRAGLRILYETPPSASHPIAVHPRVPEADRRLFSEAFLKLGQDEAGRALLKDARIPKPVAVDYEHDYRPLESLKLERYVVLE